MYTASWQNLQTDGAGVSPRGKRDSLRRFPVTPAYGMNARQTSRFWNRSLQINWSRVVKRERHGCNISSEDTLSSVAMQRGGDWPNVVAQAGLVWEQAPESGREGGVWERGPEWARVE